MDRCIGRLLRASTLAAAGMNQGPAGHGCYRGQLGSCLVVAYRNRHARPSGEARDDWHRCDSIVPTTDSRLPMHCPLGLPPTQLPPREAARDDSGSLPAPAARGCFVVKEGKSALVHWSSRRSWLDTHAPLAVRLTVVSRPRPSRPRGPACIIGACPPSYRQRPTSVRRVVDLTAAVAPLQVFF